MTATPVTSVTNNSSRASRRVCQRGVGRGEGTRLLVLYRLAVKVRATSIDV